MAGKSKFGGDKYKPHQLGPEPAAPAVSPEPVTPAPPKPEPQPSVALPAPAPETRAVPDEKWREVRVQFASRVNYATDQQFRALAKQLDINQTELLAEALNLLFKKHGLDEVA